jgi:predicted XRE-type DNA-binding protein
VIRKQDKELVKLAESWGVDFQVIKVKSELIQAIKDHCQKKKISQRQLASMVPGLSQDRISKIFTGHIGHMSIDKLVEIHSALKLKVSMKAIGHGHR